VILIIYLKINVFLNVEKEFNDVSAEHAISIFRNTDDAGSLFLLTVKAQPKLVLVREDSVRISESLVSCLISFVGFLSPLTKFPRMVSRLGHSQFLPNP
jgi:hypothetical protein